MKAYPPKDISKLDFSFSKGQLLRRETTIFSIAQEDEDYYILEHAITREKKAVLKSALYQEYLNHHLVPCTQSDVSRLLKGDLFQEDETPTVKLDVIGASEAALLHARKLYAYIKKFQAHGYTYLTFTPLLEIEFMHIKGELIHEDEFKDGKHLALRTVCIWAKRFFNSGEDFRSLIPHYDARGGKNEPRISSLARQALEHIFEELDKKPKAQIRYYNIEKDLLMALSVKTPTEKLLMEMPSISTITRLTKNHFSLYEIDVRNRGKVFADKQYRTHFSRDRAIMPLAVYEFDDKDTRNFLIDEHSGLPYGRAFVTCGVDQNTSVLVGSSISEKYRSTSSALKAYANSLLPKPTWSDEYREVKSGAEFYGIPSTVIFDNALYNHSHALANAVKETSNAYCAWAKPRTPTEKSIIEDFNGRMVADFLSTLPGYGGEKSSKDRLTEGLSKAILTIQEFKVLFHKWTYDVYCNTPRISGLTPRQGWHQGLLNNTPRTPSDLHKLRAAIAIEHHSKLRPDGVLFLGLQYINPRLIILRKQIGHNAQVTFRYDRDCLGSIYVFDPLLNEHFLVQCTNPAYAKGLTYYQQQLIMKMAKQNKTKNPALLDLMYYREELKKLVLQCRFSKKRKERKWAMQIGMPADMEAISAPTQKEKETEIITELESLVDEINLVRMDDSGEGWELPEDF